MIFPDQRRRLGICVGVGVASFVAYAATLGPGPYWQDAGIFLAGLEQGGGLAPPGYPLYLLLGQPFVGLLTLLGLDHTRAVHVFSAVWAAVTAGIVTATILLLATPGLRFFAAPVADDTPVAPLPAPALAAGAIGGPCAGWSYSLWFQAITAEVYTLNTAALATTLHLVLRLGAEGPLATPVTSRQRRLLLALAAVFGLAFANHPTAAVLFPAVVACLGVHRGLLRTPAGRFVVPVALLLAAGALRVALGAYVKTPPRIPVAIAAGAAVVPALALGIGWFRRPLAAAGIVALFLACAGVPYLYLPFLAWRDPTLQYGNVVELRDFLGHVIGAQWTEETRSYGWDWPRLWLFPGMWWDELFALGLLAFLVGVWRAWRISPWLVAFLAAALVPAWLLPQVYLQGSEYDFWLLPFYLTTLTLAGAGLAYALGWAWMRVAAPAARAALATAVAAAALVPPLCVNVPLLDRRHDHVPEDFARGLLQHLAPDALLLAASDQECSLTLYAQVVRGLRPDVIVLQSPPIGSPWYTRWVKARHPALVWPADPPPGKPRYQDEWVMAVIHANRARPVYVSGHRPPLALPPELTWVPVGALWRLTPVVTAAVDPAHWTLPYRDPAGLHRPQRLHFQRKVTLDATGAWRADRVTYLDEIRRFHQQGWLNLAKWHFDRNEPAARLAAYVRLFTEWPALDVLPIRLEALALAHREGRADLVGAWLAQIPLDWRGDPESLMHFGEIAFAAKSDARARAWLERVPPDAPAGPRSLLYLGQLAMKRGDRAAAGATFAELRRRDPALFAEYAPALRQAGLLPDG